MVCGGEHANKQLALMNTRILLHRLLFLLVTLLVFEGLGRKWLGPGPLNTALFVTKDIICFLMLLVLSSAPVNAYSRKLSTLVLSFAFFLSPLVLITFIYDPMLGLFGAKQYLLWSVVAVSMTAAYIPQGSRYFFELLTWIAILAIPTALLAVYQQRLPASHWLNTSPDGAMLEGFSAAGYLRVSSSFSFVAQYCMFLNALCFAIPASASQRLVNPVWRALKSPWVLIPFFLVGTFITGSRGAVVGNTIILTMGMILLLARGGSRAVGVAFALTAFALVSLSILRDSFPEFFSAYEARTETSGGETHTQQIIQRVSTGLFGWTEGLPPRAPATLLGYGLGIMSNGSQRISEYAASWREGAFWTETDQATTLFEGGFYLVIFWYGLRFFIIITVILWTLQMRAMRFLLPAAFAAGFVIVVGLVGTLSIQPPVAIWWWLAIGSVACLHAFDTQAIRQKRIEGVANLEKGLTITTNEGETADL